MIRTPLEHSIPYLLLHSTWTSPYFLAFAVVLVFASLKPLIPQTRREETKHLELLLMLVSGFRVTLKRGFPLIFAVDASRSQNRKTPQCTVTMGYLVSHHAATGARSHPAWTIACTDAKRHEDAIFCV
jgi:hypothetical protein